MKKPDIKILRLSENSPIHVIEMDGEKVYRTIDKQKAEAVEDMINALCMIWQELESKEDWGEDLSPSQIEKIYNALNKAGVEL